jgi:lysophospholipase L1-like esterase
MNFKRLMTVLGAIILVGTIALSWGCQNQPTGPVFGDETFGDETSKLRPEWWEGSGWSTTTTSGGYTTTTAAATTTSSGSSWWDRWSSTTTTSGGYTTTTTSGGYTTTTAAATTTSSWGGGSWWNSTTTTSGGSTTTSGGVTRIDGDQVLIIGNSFIANSHDITRNLEQLARDEGILASGDNFIDNALNSARLSGGYVKTIPQQYADGNRQRQVRWVIMSGGGNDCVHEGCNPPTASCPNLQNAVNAARDLLAQMGSDGILKVIYFFYPDPQLQGSEQEQVQGQLDILRPLIQDVVNSSREPVCYWLDLRPVFQGHYSEYIQSDGTHPTAAGSRATAEAIWDIVEQNNFFSEN